MHANVPVRTSVQVCTAGCISSNPCLIEPLYPDDHAFTDKFRLSERGPRLRQGVLDELASQYTTVVS